MQEDNRQRKLEKFEDRYSREFTLTVAAIGFLFALYFSSLIALFSFESYPDFLPELLARGVCSLGGVMIIGIIGLLSIYDFSKSNAVDPDNSAGMPWLPRTCIVIAGLLSLDPLMIIPLQVLCSL